MIARRLAEGAVVAACTLGLIGTMLFLGWAVCGR